MHYGTPAPHIAKGLIELRRRIARANIPSSSLDETLNIATWNIRDFGKSERMEGSLYYIAEVLSQFDLIGLVELRDKLDDLKKVMDYLGPYWKIIFSDYTNDRGGNNERIAYLYDTRMVRPTGLVAEVDPERVKIDGKYVAQDAWWRPPYMASFRAGNFDFVMVTCHIRWGNKDKDRVQALADLNTWLMKRVNQKGVVDQDFILMGDFNIPKIGDKFYNALTGDGKDLLLADGLKDVVGTNLSEKKSYDQILHRPSDPGRFSGVGGCLNFYQDDWEALYPDPNHRPVSARKFTWEMSDHMPLWLQVKTDFMDTRLQMLSAP